MRHKTLRAVLLCASLVLLAGSRAPTLASMPPDAPALSRDLQAGEHHLYLPAIPRELPGAVLLRAWGAEVDLLSFTEDLDVYGERVYVADTMRHRILILDRHGRPLATFGEQGSAEGQFGTALDVAVDGQGTLYVADAANNRVQVFAADGTYLRQWGGDDGEAGQFSYPTHIAADRAEPGSIYVMDTGFSRIQVFTGEGTFLRQWELDEGQIPAGGDLAVDGTGTVYLTDLANSRVLAYSSEGTLLRQWGSYGGDPGQFRSPSGIVVDRAEPGTVYVTDSETDRVQAFTREGAFLRRWTVKTGEEEWVWPHSLAVDESGIVYVAVGRSQTIRAFTSEGAFVRELGSGTTSAGQFSYPTGIALDPADGTVYIADQGNNRIQAFTGEGTFARQWGTYGEQAGQFMFPAGITVDEDRTVYVTDGCWSTICYGRGNRVQTFTPEGAFLDQWGGPGSGEGQFAAPRDIAVDAGGTVYVADTDNHRVQVFAPDRSFLRQWGSPGSGPGQFDTPESIAVDPRQPGLVYVADEWNDRIQAFSAEGAYRHEWGGPGSGAGQLHWPSGVAVDAHGTVYVADSGNHRVQAFSSQGEVLRQWGRPDGEIGPFYAPTAIAVDGRGTVYVVDAEVGRVLVFAPEHPAPDPVYGLALNGSFEERPELAHWGYGGELPVALVQTSIYGGRTVRLGAPVPAEPQAYGTAWLRQTIYVRPEWARPVLRFHYRVQTNDTLDRADLIVWLSRLDGLWLADVLRDGYPGPAAPTPAHDLGRREAAYDLSAYKGQHVRLTFENRNLEHGVSLGIWTLVDDVQVVDAGP